jgi:hypothetical protein
LELIVSFWSLPVHPNQTTRTWILLWCVGLLAVVAAHSWIKALPSQAESYHAAVAGSFGAHADTTVDPARAIATWEAPPGAAGTVSIGPFPAPDHLVFAVRGDPGAAGNGIYLELQVIKIRIQVAAAPSDRWSAVSVDMPFGWRGRLITLNAAAGPAGGLAISQPYGRGTGSTRQYGLAETLGAWLANGFLYGALFATVCRHLARRQTVAPCWIPLASCGAIALLGYLAFWAYFASPAIGRVFSGAVFAATLLANLPRAGRFDDRDREWIRIACAAALVGLLYIGIFHLFPVQRDFYELASDRFTAGLPGDNRLPFDFSDQLYHGQRPRELGAGWLSSDRPPLQEGWQLLGWPVTGWAGFSDQTASGTASVWFQLLWVFALYGLLRSMGLGPRRAIPWVMAASLNGFFLLHTLYTWPKLCAAAFVCAAYGMWVMGGCGSPLRGRLLGGLFAALAYLCHGGAAFSLMALLPWIVWRCFRREFAPWLLAGVVFGAAVAPWMAYQRIYAPPGNRLLKWHFAGDYGMDDKPVGQAIADAYHGMTWRQILARKASNLEYQAQGDWAGAMGGSARSADARRTDEYFHMFRALGWWGLALPLLLLSLPGAAFRRRLDGSAREQWAMGAWIAASVVAWCLLLFTQTEIATGSLAVMVALFALCACWYEAAWRGCLACVAALQAYTLATTWVPGNSAVGGPVSAASAALIALAAMAAAAMMLRMDQNGTEAR